MQLKYNIDDLKVVHVSVEFVEDSETNLSHQNVNKHFGYGEFWWVGTKLVPKSETRDFYSWLRLMCNINTW